jgi:DNA-binding NarL/FixJ family response regulator
VRADRIVTSVAVVDDHPIVREGIVATLADSGDFRIAGTAATARDAIALAERERPDVMLLDLELPGGSGLEAIAAIKRASPSTRVVIFSAYAGEDRVGAALAAGADSYVLKGTASDELLETVRAVASGQTRMDAAIAAQAFEALRAPRQLRLTEREREILKLLGEGLSNKAIAAQLGITERTVKFHVGEILGRLGASNRTQAVALAQQRGLL